MQEENYIVNWKIIAIFILVLLSKIAKENKKSFLHRV